MNGPTILNNAREQLAGEIFAYREPKPAPLNSSPWLAMSLLQKAMLQDAEVAKREAHDAIKAGFNPFHASFSDNVDEVAQSIRQTLETQYKYVGLGTLHAGIVMLKGMDRNEDALALIKYFETNQEASFWEPEADPFEGPIDDPDVQAAALANKAKVVEKFDLAEALVEASKSLNSAAEKKLADQITPATMYSLIKSREGSGMKNIIHAGLSFARYENASEDMRKIVNATKQALEMIAHESKRGARKGVWRQSYITDSIFERVEW